MVIGLTGGMGCGKSTAGRWLEERHGFARLDADQQVREVILTAAEVKAALLERFGAAVFLAGGEVDRAALGRVVFVEAAAREWFEALVHPLVYAGWREALRAAPKGKHVIEVPLLFEQGLENWFDFTVCVATSCDRQLSLLERRGVPPAAAIPRISQQMPLAQKTEKADFVLLNDGLPEFLQAQIDRLIARLS